MSPVLSLEVWAEIGECPYRTPGSRLAGSDIAFNCRVEIDAR